MKGQPASKPAATTTRNPYQTKEGGEVLEGTIMVDSSLLEDWRHTRLVIRGDGDDYLRVFFHRATGPYKPAGYDGDDHEKPLVLRVEKEET